MPLSWLGEAKTSQRRVNCSCKIMGFPVLPYIILTQAKQFYRKKVHNGVRLNDNGILDWFWQKYIKPPHHRRGERGGTTLLTFARCGNGDGANIITFYFIKFESNASTIKWGLAMISVQSVYLIYFGNCGF